MAQKFEDRTGSNLNRRILKIIKREGDEVTVDIRRADSYEQEGTKINAKTFNDWEDRITNAESNSSDAKATANSTIETANNALEKSNAASTKSTQASTNAQRALDYVNALVSNVDYSQIQGDGAPAVSFLNNSDGTKRFSFRNLKGSKGDNVYVRYSFDKTTMTEQPTEETMYIGFYYGSAPSNDVNDYSWTRIWGAQSISSTEYAQLVLNDEVNPEQIYFVEGASDNKLVVTIDASSVAYSNVNSGLKATTMQSALDELKNREFSKSYADLTDKPTIPTNSSFTLAGLSEKSYSSLTDKPTIPTNSSFTLAGLSEKSYSSLTDKPTIPTNSSFTLAGLSEKSYSSLTDKPTIPTNSSFTLAGLSEKSYNSLTDKPIIPTINKETIAQALGLEEYELENLIQLSRIATYDGQGIIFYANYIDVQ